VGLADTCVLVDLHYNDITTGPLTPVARRVRVDNFRVGTAAAANRGIYLFGLSGDPVLDVAIANSSFASVTTPEVETNVSGVTLTNITANGLPLTSRSPRLTADLPGRYLDCLIICRGDAWTVDE
jgi:hypothetical protein